MEELIDSYSTDVSDFYAVTNIKIYESPPTPVQFLRECIMDHQPCIIRGLSDGWPAMKWNFDYIREKYGDINVDVNLTDDGRADSVKRINGDDIFTYPYAHNMLMKEFIDMLVNEDHVNNDIVPYLSAQDDNIRQKLPELLQDIPASIDLADTCFYNEYDEEKVLAAINLWIGDERSVSSIHKDHYENFYCCIYGEKLFTLLPPSDILHLQEKTVKTKKYERNLSVNEPKIELVLTEKDVPSDEITWIVDDPVEDVIPNIHPVNVRLGAGEVLYIPSLWYHRVSQSMPTIAVNYWYEMKFNHRVVHYNLARKLKEVVNSN